MKRLYIFLMMSEMFVHLGWATEPIKEVKLEATLGVWLRHEQRIEERAEAISLPTSASPPPGFFVGPASSRIILHTYRLVQKPLEGESDIPEEILWEKSFSLEENAPTSGLAPRFRVYDVVEQHDTVWILYSEGLNYSLQQQQKSEGKWRSSGAVKPLYRGLGVPIHGQILLHEEQVSISLEFEQNMSEIWDVKDGQFVKREQP